VRRGAPSRFIVGDLPFGSYEEGPRVALRNALRLVKEAGVDAVKIEGGRNRVDIVRKLVQSGIAVMGHVGLTPQGIGVLGGFRAQGRTAVKAKQIVEDALALQEAGAFSIGVYCCVLCIFSCVLCIVCCVCCMLCAVCCMLYAVYVTFRVLYMSRISNI
jgi:3-methyl-2-oxobutanoate hydroxymethyltransferase